jgi:hypothetical protein
MSVETMLVSVLRARGLALFERLPNRTYHPFAPLPDWVPSVFDAAAPGGRGTLAGALPFLDDFLPLAEHAWERGGDETAQSGPFVAVVGSDELLLRAEASTVEGRKLLLVEHLTGEADTRPMLRKVRQNMLDAETVVRQVSELHAPAAVLDREIAQLAAMPLADHQPAIVARLRRANDQLRAALAHLPKPPDARKRRG